jgi:ABC-type Fe3+/spermidine/putrescine transport system ATPase subunit
MQDHGSAEVFVTGVSTASSGVNVRGLSKSHGNNRSLRGVSFEVPASSFCTLLGPSGCGKTTTLRLLAGLDRPDTGDVSIGGRLVNSNSVYVAPERREVGFVFQAYALWPHMTVFDQVAYPLRVRRMPRHAIKDSVAKILDVVGLTAKVDRYPSELSGGEQQRVALARAMVFEPKVLLLDEPLSNLDAALRRQMRRQLMEVHRLTQVTTIYVTHDQEEAMALSDQVIVMANGSIVESGAPRDVYEHPKTLYTASFVGTANLLPGIVTAMNAAKNVVEITLDDGQKASGTLAGAGVEIGERAVLAVKPEDVQVLTSEQVTSGALRAVVRMVEFLGSRAILRLSIAGTEIRLPVDKSTELAADDQVFASVPIALASVFSTAGAVDRRQ